MYFDVWNFRDGGFFMEKEKYWFFSKIFSDFRVIGE